MWNQPPASAICARGREISRRLEQVEHAARIAIRSRDQQLARGHVNGKLQAPKAALLIRERTIKQFAQVLCLQGLEHVHAGARQQRIVDFE